ncbi:hypothetical protein BTO15_12180 [Polaribacter sejongensis]|uniref:Glycosyl transferase family 1 domain-containing protein n=1 Tax=Polaribacter sejongensis TaxID=985043 RepID=A0ABN5F5Q6_9FLAO|nr:glycosyltransferase family 4 protein [Polaribacter sejongensis]AUC22798.1 hypothetical protein BTO15_12180 [Polaribacter sejongensis]
MKNHKTVIITSSPQITSATTYFNELGRTFMEMGFKVVIIFDKNKIRDDDSNGLIYKTWPSKRPTKLADLLFLREVIKEEKPIYIISTFGAVNISMIGGFLFGIKNRIAWYRTTSTQLKVDSQRHWFKEKILKTRKSLLLNLFATEIHTNSEKTAEDLKEYLSIKNKHIKIIYFLLKDFTLNFNVKKEEIVSFVGRFNPSKGQEVLINAIPTILEKHPNYIFYFVGDGITRSEQIVLSKKLNVYNSCVFTGSISQKGVYEILAKSKLHVSASEDEAFGMVNLEAIAFNTPILAHKVGGIPEILDEKINGYFFDFKSSENLSYRINKVLDNETLYLKLQEGARSVFENKFLLNTSNLKKRVELILKK